MKKLLAKLNSRSGASILLALLLFLVCALAGAAAITASASNVGRYSYLEGDQQQYLSAASAAKLIRSQLDGLKAEGTYSVEISAAEKAEKDSSDIIVQTSIDENGFTKAELIYNNVPKPTFSARYSRNNKEIPDSDKDIVRYFKTDFEKAFEQAFYSYLTKLPESDPTDIDKFWKKSIGNYEDYKGKLNDFVGKYSLELYCEEMDGDEPVNIEIEITPPAKISGDTDDKEFKDFPFTATISLKETKFEMTGELEAEVSETVKNVETVYREYEMEDTGPRVDPTQPNPTVKTQCIDNMVTKCEVTASLTFKLDNDKVISRVHDEKEGEAP